MKGVAPTGALRILSGRSRLDHRHARRHRRQNRAGLRRGRRPRHARPSAARGRSGAPGAVGPIGSRRWTRASVLGAIPQSPPNSSARRSERADQRRAGGSRGGRDARRCCSRGPSRRRTPRRQQAPSVPLEAGPRRAWRVSVLGLARRAVGDSPLASNAGAAHSGTSARTTSFVHAVDRRAGAQRRRSCATRQHRRRRASIQPEAAMVVLSQHAARGRAHRDGLGHLAFYMGCCMDRRPGHVTCATHDCRPLLPSTQSKRKRRLAPIVSRSCLRPGGEPRAALLLVGA